MSLPAKQTISIVRDQDLSLRFTMDEVTSIASWAVTFSVKLRSATGTLGSALVTKTVGSGVTLTDTTNGIITVTLADTDTSSLTLTEALSAGERYVWDLKRTDAGSEVVLARGDLVLEQNVS